MARRIRRDKEPSLKKTVKASTTKAKEPDKKYDGNFEKMISTGSTLLDLAISGGVTRYGGIPSGILAEIFGKSGSGKTVLLCEMAGDVQRKGGQSKFNDPEGRLNKQFAKIFDFKIDPKLYSQPNTIPEVFEPIRTWEPKDPKVANGIFSDSLTALSTDLEMDNADGDKMGMRRAKEFSEQCRKTCRVLVQKDLLMACSNQIRQTGNQIGEKYKSPGGEAVAFYASLRLKTERIKKLTEKKKIKGKEHQRTYGILTEVEVYKSSVWKPFRKAHLYIVFDYGIDDIRANLQFVKEVSGASTYTIDGNEKLGVSMDDAIAAIEEGDLEQDLKEATIDLWHEVEDKFKKNRKKKRR